MTPAIPFLVGLVGNGAAVSSASTEKFADYLERLRRKAPHTPFVILSRLASGREIALAQTARQAGHEVWLLGSDTKVGAGGTALASRQIEVPAIPDSTAADTSAALWEIAWLCRHCNVLIALIDNHPRDTAQAAIDYRLHSLPTELGGKRGVLFAPETGPAVAIAPDQDLQSYFPSGESHDTLAAQVTELDDFNRLALGAPQTTHACPLGQEITEASEQALVSSHCLADSLSRVHQETVKRQYFQTLRGSFVAILVLQVLGTVLPTLPQADLYALFFFGLGSVYFWQRQHAASDRHADYRVLAEALRVQIFWRQAGLPDAVAEQFMHKHRSRLAWVREALKVFHLEAAAIPDARPDKCLPHWIRQQVNYHEESRRRHARLEDHYDKGTITCYGISLALTLLIFLPTKQLFTTALLDWCSALLGVTASTGTLLMIYKNSMGFAQRAAMGDRLARLFDATRQLFDAGKISDLEKSELIRDLGREVLFETGEWIYSEGPS